MKKLLATALVLFAIISLVSCTGTPAGGNDSKVDDQNEESAATSGSDEDKKEISSAKLPWWTMTNAQLKSRASKKTTSGAIL